VITHPQHPYTRLLIDSIPWPDIDRRWGQTEIKAQESDITDHAPGCRFLSRCPFAMDKCRVTPPLFRLGGQQAASCYLHENNPQIEAERLSELLS
jgi:peptide/nickel transport system ATP-binding protein